ncbi:hypothetical protein [Chryseolinea sp. H1M3-3]|uniref:hypothetical protein n=1 Tax=Chryseolinea sp. H1M3-3 TaxID=3034144 RepID=UPI0023EDC05A|nr:hypothetical protein [Chryseolinea sp. H1M3-3]
MNYTCLASICFFVLLGSFLFSCEKTDPAPENPVEDSGSTNADTIANHLLFSNATKIAGKIPVGPVGSSLKISIEDTLSLVDKFRVPVKFLHEDTTKNVAGVYVQIHVGASDATFYYDVPEVSDVASNDTVSLILIGIDREELIEGRAAQALGNFPSDVRFELTFIPYDVKGQTLGQVKVPVYISNPVGDISGECGLANGIGEYWVWGMSYISDPVDPTKLTFFNSRERIWGLKSQLIEGCCTNGESAYTPNCRDENKHKLAFQAYFNWPNELYQFYEWGEYNGMSEFLAADPDPNASDFCGFRDGVVREHLDRRFLEGTWKVTSDSFLETLGTTTPQIGNLAARPLGKIVQLDCNYLIIEQTDLEDHNRILVKFYVRWDSDDFDWFALD